MKKVVFITPEDAGFGFELAGVRQIVAQAEAASSALEALKVAVSDPEAGVVVVDERLMKEIGEKEIESVEARWDGILLVLPAPEWMGAPTEDYVLALIRRAIGYHMKIETGG